jgi:hypothetical protein
MDMGWRHQLAMKATPICCVLVSISCMANAQVGEPERVLNLKNLQLLFVRASGKNLFLGVTNQPPELSALIKSEPTPLRKRDTSLRERKIKVLLGRDLIGFAEISNASHGPLPTASTNTPTIRLTTVFLTFDTEEQAAKAAEALRLPDAIPKPLEKSPTNGM